MPDQIAGAAKKTKTSKSKRAAIIIVEFRKHPHRLSWAEFGVTDDPSWAKELFQACRNFFPSCECRIRREPVASSDPLPSN